MKDSTELVVLVDEAGNPIGEADKATVHTTDTPLHLAFSCYVFNDNNEVLVTRRALSKKTWPGVWTNSFCGHPAPGEDMHDAISRRAAYELGLEVGSVEVAVADFRYRAIDASGIVEYEICPVFVAKTFLEPTLNPEEVSEYVWANPQELATSITNAPFAFSPWLTLQVPQLHKAGKLLPSRTFRMPGR